MTKATSMMGKILLANVWVTAFGVFLTYLICASPPSNEDTVVSSGRCSMRMRRTRMMKCRKWPYMIHTSINLIIEVCGSFEDTVWFRVYITSIAVMATGMLTLKCSCLK